MYLSAQNRIASVMDEGTFEEWDRDLTSVDPLGFNDKKSYPERIKSEQIRTGLRDAVVTGTGMIRARRVAFGVTDSAFIMGSMGSAADRSGQAADRLAAAAAAECRTPASSPRAASAVAASHRSDAERDNVS